MQQNPNYIKYFFTNKIVHKHLLSPLKQIKNSYLLSKNYDLSIMSLQGIY